MDGNDAGVRIAAGVDGGGVVNNDGDDDDGDEGLLNFVGDGVLLDNDDDNTDENATGNDDVLVVTVSDFLT